MSPSSAHPPAFASPSSLAFNAPSHQHFLTESADMLEEEMYVVQHLNALKAPPHKQPISKHTPKNNVFTLCSSTTCKSWDVTSQPEIAGRCFTVNDAVAGENLKAVFKDNKINFHYGCNIAGVGSIPRGYHVEMYSPKLLGWKSMCTNGETTKIHIANCHPSGCSKDEGFRNDSSANWNHYCGFKLVPNK